MLSKFNLFRACASSGVLAATCENAAWAGDGVTCTKSAKLNAVCGVWGAPGVVIIDEGKTACLRGGVVGVKGLAFDSS